MPIPAIQPRKAGPEDFDTVYDLLSQFLDNTPYRAVELTREHVQNVLQNAVVFLVDGGVLVGMVSPFMLNPAILIGTEIAWYSPNGGGKELREAFEEWSREQGAHAVQFSALDGKARDNLLKNGYTPVELAFMKVFE